MKFELDKNFEIEGKTYDLSEEIDKFIEERFKKGVCYGEIDPVANSYDAEDWCIVHHTTLGKDRIFKIENIYKEDGKYFIETTDENAISLLKTGNCKFSKRVFVDSDDVTEDIKAFTIITIDIVINQYEIANLISKIKYKLDKIKEGTFFGNKISIEYYSAEKNNSLGNDYIETREFVKLKINDKYEYKGDLATLLYGRIEPIPIRFFFRYLDQITEEKDIKKDIYIEEYTGCNINFYKDELAGYKKIFEFIVDNTESYNIEDKISISGFKGYGYKNLVFVVSYANSGNIIRTIRYCNSFLFFIRNEFKMPILDYINLVKDTKDLNKIETPYRLSFLSCLKNFSEKDMDDLLKLIDNLPKDEYETILLANHSMKEDGYDVTSYHNTYKIVGEDDDTYKRYISMIFGNNRENVNILSEDNKSLYITIPKETLEEKFGVLYFDKSNQFFHKKDNIFSEGGEVFTVLKDRMFNNHKIFCVDIKNPSFALSKMPEELVDYIEEIFKNQRFDINDVYRRFEKYRDKYIKLFNTLEESDILEYFEENKVASTEDLFNEFIKIKKLFTDNK